MKTYCVKQRKKTKSVPGRTDLIETSNGRYILTDYCEECGAKKSRFISEYELNKPKMPRLSKFQQRPDQDERIREIIKKMPEVKITRIPRSKPLPEKLVLPNLFESTYSPYTDKQARALIKKMKPKERAELKLPNRTEFDTRPDIDRTVRNIIGRMPESKKYNWREKMIVPQMVESDYVQKVDRKIAKLIDRMPETKPVRRKPTRKPLIKQPILQELSMVDIAPDLDRKYQTIVNKMLQSRYNKLKKNQGNLLARLKGRA